MDSDKNIKIVNDEIINKGRFLEFCKKEIIVTKENEESKYFWEYFKRVGNGKKTFINGSECIAISKKSEKYPERKIIIIENFRFPVEKRVLEFPAGLLDESDYKELNEYLKNRKEEDIDENTVKSLIDSMAVKCALRELKEETGYIGNFKGFHNFDDSYLISPSNFQNVYFSPWASSENSSMVNVEFDIDQKEEIKQSLDSVELIKIHLVPVKGLFSFICEKVKNEGYGCSAHLFYFAFGMSFGINL